MLQQVKLAFVRPHTSFRFRDCGLVSLHDTPVLIQISLPESLEPRSKLLVRGVCKNASVALTAFQAVVLQNVRVDQVSLGNDILAVPQSVN